MSPALPNWPAWKWWGLAIVLLAIAAALLLGIPLGRCASCGRDAP